MGRAEKPVTVVVGRFGKLWRNQGSRRPLTKTEGKREQENRDLSNKPSTLASPAACAESWPDFVARKSFFVQAKIKKKKVSARL